MRTIDGSTGEGGGQVLRTALSLAAVTGEAVRIESVRAGRHRPGLRRQHLTALRALADVTGAGVEGDAIGSTGVVFRPGAPRAGTYAFSTGGAGSTTLVLQTLLPALLAADGPSEVELEGGTHNPFAPPFPFIEGAFLPLLRRMGAGIEATLERPGFYPAGGGRIRARVVPPAVRSPGNVADGTTADGDGVAGTAPPGRPADDDDGTPEPGDASVGEAPGSIRRRPRLRPLELLERGEVREVSVAAVVSALPRHIAEREVRTAQGILGIDERLTGILEVEDPEGPGNAVWIRVVSEHVAEVFTGFGEKGVPAEEVAGGAARAAARYIDAGAPVGPHLADQLLVPLALAGGGAFRTSEPTGHARTNARVIGALHPARIGFEEEGAGVWRVEVDVDG